MFAKLEPQRGSCSAVHAVAALLEAEQAAFEVVAPWIWSCRLTEGLRGVLRPAWELLWWCLDRLAARRTAAVSDTLEFGPGDVVQVRQVDFQMALHPPYLPGNDLSVAAYWFLSDRIRAYSHSHCNPAFQATVEAMVQAGGYGPRLNVVDVGAHLGDCCLWIVARLGREGAGCLAVEPDQDSVAALRLSIELNGFESAVQVQAAMVSDGDTDCGTESSAATVRGDCLLAEWDRPHLVNVFTSGSMELSALASFRATLASGEVPVWLVRTSEQPPEKIVAFVKQHNLEYSVETLRDGKDTRLVSMRGAGKRRATQLGSGNVSRASAASGTLDWQWRSVL